MTRKLRVPSGMPLVNAIFGGWSALVMVFLYAPILLLIVYSFNRAEYGIAWQGFTLDWYRKMIADSVLMTALKNSVIIATISTVFSVVIGTTGAWLLFRYRFPAVRWLSMLVFIPMAVPEILMGVSLLVLFSIVINWLTGLQNLEAAPAWFANLEIGTGFTTVILAHITFCFPFVLIAVQARLSGVDPALEEAAMDLGAKPLQAFTKVMVPYMTPAIISGALMAFALSLDEIIISLFVYGPDAQPLPVVMYGRAKKGLDPSLNAVSTIFILATIALVLLSEANKRRNR
jgi:spermidine/putrescine transport system permease protein